MRTVVLLIAALALGGCVTETHLPAAAEQTSRTYNTSFDKVWGVIVGNISVDCPIQNIDKASGLLVTQPMSLATGIMSGTELQKVAWEPPGAFSTWDGARCVLTFFVTSPDATNTTVRITARFAGFENNVTGSWHDWPSKGVLEDQYLNKISSSLE
jgi:hypothetical protein